MTIRSLWGLLDAVSILSSVTKLTVRTSSASYMLGEVFRRGVSFLSGRVVGMHPIGASALVPGHCENSPILTLRFDADPRATNESRANQIRKRQAERQQKQLVAFMSGFDAPDDMYLATKF